MWNEIKDFAAPELDVYARISEVQLLRYYEPEPGIFIAESPKVIERALNAGYQPISFLVEHKDLEGEAQEILKQYPDVPVYTVSTSHPETNGYEMYLRFSAPGGRYYGGDAAYYGAPVQNKVDPNNTEKLTVRIGTDPNHLSEELKFSKSGEIASEYYDIGRYLYGPEKEIRAGRDFGRRIYAG